MISGPPSSELIKIHNPTTPKRNGGQAVTCTSTTRWNNNVKWCVYFYFQGKCIAGTTFQTYLAGRIGFESARSVTKVVLVSDDDFFTDQDPELSVSPLDQKLFRCSASLKKEWEKKKIDRHIFCVFFRVFSKTCGFKIISLYVNSPWGTKWTKQIIYMQKYPSFFLFYFFYNGNHSITVNKRLLISSIFTVRQKLSKWDGKQIMNSKFNIEILEGEEKQDGRGLIEASLVTETKKTKTNDTSTPLAERGWQCVSECKWMKINRRVGGDGEQNVNRHRRGRQTSFWELTFVKAAVDKGERRRSRQRRLTQSSVHTKCVGVRIQSDVEVDGNAHRRYCRWRRNKDERRLKRQQCVPVKCLEARIINSSLSIFPYDCSK